MAIQVRIDDVIITGESCEVRFTKGQAPLPLTWQGEANILTRASVIVAIQTVQDVINENLIAILLALWWKANPTLSNAATVKGKTVTLDLTGVSNFITVA